MPQLNREPIDLAKHHEQTDVRMVVGGFLIIAVIGGLAIWILYGRALAVIGEALILGGIVVFGLLWLMLRFIGESAK